MNNRTSQDATLVAHHGRTVPKKFSRTLGCLAGLGLCIVLVTAVTGGYYYVSSSGDVGPLVLIREPQNGSQITVGETVTVQAVASDPNKVTRVELWVDGVLIDSETSNVPGGISSFPLLTDWHPTTNGMHTIMVRAFNAHGTRAHSTVNIEATAFTDGDTDGVNDNIDLCPDVAGLDTSNGCPDRDNDGIADGNDSCPDTAGLPGSSGCPAVAEGDRDGDGTPDSSDACPDASGSALVEGCPDSDGDLVADGTDLCPTEPGSDESGGCADTAIGDDLPPTGEDEIPTGVGTSDSDGDGAADDIDPCPDEAGTLETGFCPSPTEDPPPADAGPMLEIPFLFFEAVAMPDLVEFEALHFEVTSEYRRIWCYAQLAGGDMERYEFEPGEGLAWDIKAVLGGANSAHLTVPHGERLPVFAECYGLTSLFGPRVLYLGSISREHDPEEWDGHVIQRESTGEEIEGHGFTVRYRICSPNCEADEFQPPIIMRYTTDGRRIHLYWDWEGELRSIQGFKMYLNGSAVQWFPPEERDWTWEQSGTYCVDDWEFQMTSFGGPDPHTPDIESAPGNSIVWDSVPCQKQVRVTFETIDLHDPPADEGGEHNPGPLSGSFVAAAGANMVTLGFDATHCPRFPFPPFEECFGFKLPAGEYPIQHIFDRIHEVHDACTPGLPCHGWYFHAPNTDTVTIGIDPGDDLTLRSRIVDADERDEDDVLFEEQITVDSGDLVPEENLTVTIPGSHLDVIVKLDLFPFEP